MTEVRQDIIRNMDLRFITSKSLSNKVIITYKNNIQTVKNRKSNQLELFYGKTNNI